MTVDQTPRLWDFDQIEAFYEQYANEYDKDIERNKESYPAPFIVGQWVAEALATPEATAAAAGRPLRILDLGCGTGQSSRVFFNSPALAANVSVVGIDGSAAMLAKARRFPFAELRQANIEETALPEPLDAVICTGVLEFIRDPAALLGKVRAALLAGPPAGGGLVGFTAPESGDLNRFSRAQVEALVSASGFTLVQYDLFHGYTDSSTGEVVKYHGMLARAT